MGEPTLRERMAEERSNHYALLSPRHTFGRGYETYCICGETVSGKPGEPEWEQHIKIAAGWSPTRDAFERGEAKGRNDLLAALDDPAILDAVERAIARSARPPHETAVAAVRRHLTEGEA